MASKGYALKLALNNRLLNIWEHIEKVDVKQHVHEKVEHNLLGDFEPYTCQELRLP